MVGCQGCRNGKELGFDFDMAFQPILDTRRGRVWGYEALVRGTAGEGAGEILSRVTEENRYVFDQACRVKAIAAAKARFDVPDLYLSINFLPNAVYEPSACIRATLEAARLHDFPLSKIMFEFTEDEFIRDTGHINTIVNAYREMGFLTALDDFGAGYAGLSRLADTRTDILKIDMKLIRGIDACGVRRAIVRGLLLMAEGVGVQLLAEGVETHDEFLVLSDMGISLFQGYLFGRPSLSRLDSAATLRRAANTRPALATRVG